MKGICLLLAVLVCVSAHNIVDQEWENFKTKYEKKYTEEEEIHRHKVFLANKKMVEDHNKKYDAGEVTFFMAINKFSDLEHSETGFLRGAKRTAEDLKIKGAKLYEARKGVTYPDGVDWTTQGYVTGVKDQGQCGSCWAFSTTGSLEGQHFKYTGALISLSEQNLVDCVDGNDCNGGWMTTAFSYILGNGGIDTESSYPYTAQNGNCQYNPGNIGATVAGWVELPSGDENSLLAAVADQGPISVAIDASYSSFQSYGGGVYYEPSCSTNNLDHGVLVAGYGNDNGADFWLVKNSWGEGWGSGGYLLMARNAGNNCGIATAPSYPLV